MNSLALDLAKTAAAIGLGCTSVIFLKTAWDIAKQGPQGIRKHREALDAISAGKAEHSPLPISTSLEMRASGGRLEHVAVRHKIANRHFD